MTETVEVGLPKFIFDKLGIKPGTTIKGKKIIEVEYTLEIEEED